MYNELSKRIVNRIFVHPLFYKHLRGAAFFGLRTDPIQKALALQDGDSVIDVGCGTGDYSILVDSPRYSYLGIDLNEKYISRAIQTYSAPNRQFKVLDILKMRFEEKQFTKSLYIGVLHHLSDQENIAVLSEVNRITRERVVVMDLSPGSWNPLSNLLCRLDRGRYPRVLKDQCSLLEKVMKVETTSNYYVRSGVLRLSLVVCRPR